MPIKIPSDLPAFDVLTQEGVMVMGEARAARQDIRPLRICLLNLMPKKIQTETQFARLIGATPLQVELDLMRMSEHRTRNTAASHMESFYRPFSEVLETGDKFDGLIITGAPVEHLDFADVTYWDEMRRVLDWSRTHAHSVFAVCWGAMAMIHHFHGVAKHMLERKAFGCFRHDNVVASSPLLRGFSDDCVIPVSRWTEMRRDEIEATGSLRTLLHSNEVGPCLVDDAESRSCYIFNHLEYDSDTLKQEYDRDLAEGAAIDLPRDYFPDDDPSRMPQNRWRSHAHLLYGNWINEVYQSTPYHLDQIGR